MISSRHGRMVATVIGVMLMACASAPGGSGASGTQRNLLLGDEITKAGFTDAYATVQSLRPQWLVARGTTSFTRPETIKVYLDGSQLGTPENLRQISTSSIASMRFMDSMEATNRYGLDHGMGAILVFSKK